MASNLQNKILNVLSGSRNVKDIDSVLSDLKNLQNKLIKNYSDINFSAKGKNQILKKYNDLETIGKSVYKYKILSQNNLSEAAKEQANNAPNLVLKGGISNVRYIWQADPNACEECQALDGTEYEAEDDIPEKPHENCQCHIEIVSDEDTDDPDDEPCDCIEMVQEWLDECEELCSDSEGAIEDANSVTDELESIMDYIQSYTMDAVEEVQDELNDLKEKYVDELVDAIGQVIDSIQIFSENYFDLVELKDELGYYLDGSAEYYHTKANCEAAQLGDVGAKMATMLGYLREFIDFPKEILFKGYSAKDAFEHSVHDLEVNKAGRELGKENPDKDPGDIIIRPKGMPPDFR